MDRWTDTGLARQSIALVCCGATVRASLRVRRYVPSDEPAMAEVLEVVVERLGACVDRAAMPAWPPAALSACPVAQV